MDEHPVSSLGWESRERGWDDPTGGISPSIFGTAKSPLISRQ